MWNVFQCEGQEKPVIFDHFINLYTDLLHLGRQQREEEEKGELEKEKKKMLHVVKVFFGFAKIYFWSDPV